MKFRGYLFMKNWEVLFIIPTIQLIKNDLVYMSKNFRVALHWLGWHMSWLWIERSQNEVGKE